MDNSPAPEHVLPPGVRCGHVSNVALPKGFTMHCRLGQLVDVRDAAGNPHLLSETDTHFVLHRRVSPEANGHERNLTEYGPSALAFAKPDADDGQ